MGEQARGTALSLQTAPLPALVLTSSPPREGPASSGVAAAAAQADFFWRRLAEFVAIFGLLPLTFFIWPTTGVLIPALVVGGVACVVVLWRDPAFDRRRLLNVRAVGGQWRMIAAFGLIGMASMLAGVAYFDPDRLFWLPRNKPGLWAAIMIGYPLMSVYPQQVIYRAFLMHRYRAVFPGRWTMIAASGGAFCFGHVMFQSWLAIALTLIGGVLFAWRYDRSKSLAAVWLEHTVWGCLIFTIGLGTHFFLGAVALGVQ